MRDWKNTTKKEIDNMTLEEALEIVQRHIDMGLNAIKNPKDSTFAPRYHMTKALMLLVEEVTKHTEDE